MESKNLDNISDIKQALHFYDISSRSNIPLGIISDHGDDSLDIISDNYIVYVTGDDEHDFLMCSDAKWCYADNNYFTRSSVIISTTFAPRSGFDHEYHPIYTNLYKISEIANGE